jgi:hypothetical protein
MRCGLSCIDREREKKRLGKERDQQDGPSEWQQRQKAGSSSLCLRLFLSLSASSYSFPLCINYGDTVACMHRIQ